MRAGTFSTVSADLEPSLLTCAGGCWECIIISCRAASDRSVRLLPSTRSAMTSLFFLSFVLTVMQLSFESILWTVGDIFVVNLTRG